MSLIRRNEEKVLAKVKAAAQESSSWLELKNSFYKSIPAKIASQFPTHLTELSLPNNQVPTCVSFYQKIRRIKLCFVRRGIFANGYPLAFLVTERTVGDYEFTNSAPSLQQADESAARDLSAGTIEGTRCLLEPHVNASSCGL